MSIAKFTRTRCAELADFLHDCCVGPLAFEGDLPNAHSAHNHVHLWALEYWADRHTWIDLDYRVDFAEHILDRWRGRLKGLAPYHHAGYRMYLYEDMAPTVSVVAETPFGFPYPDTPVFVNGTREIMALYVGRSWRMNFAPLADGVTRDQVLGTIERQAGSIAKPTAQALGLQVGALRTLIEHMGLEDRVNAIRKRYRRRPARFRADEAFAHSYRIYERRLPAAYR